MKKILLALLLLSVKSYCQFNFSTTTVTTSVVNNPSVTVLNPSVSIIGTPTVSIGNSTVTVANPSVTVLNPSVSIIGTPTVSIGSSTATNPPNSALTFTFFTGANATALKTAFDIWRSANPSSVVYRTEIVSPNAATRELFIEFKP